MTVAKFTTPGGEELVVLSRAEYEALLSGTVQDAEDAADAALYAERKADLDAGRDVRLPREVSAFVLRGDSLLRALRKWRDMTQMQLAFKTSLTQGYISDIEAGRKAGTPETLRELAKALDIDAAWLRT